MPLCIDLFCGLGGWAEGFLSEGWRVVGFDITRHVYGSARYPAQLILQDVLTMHGSQFRTADIIVASPPCQQYSWLAMPWSRSKDPNNSKAAKALRAKWEAEGPDNALFNACFRIQREASEAAGRRIPLVVENVRGAQEWVGINGPCADIPLEERWSRGRSSWNYGSFHLWGDVPALMPINMKRAMKLNPDGTEHPRGDNQTCGKYRMGLGAEGLKTTGHVNKRDGYSHTRHLTNQRESDAVKIGGDWFSDPECHSAHGSKSSARKAASAMIAKIPFELAAHIARVYYPTSSPDREG